MEVKTFRMTNLGRFSQIDIPLAPTAEKPSNVTVLVGNNGAGKTSILKSLATALSWYVARLRREKGSGSPLPENTIKNDTATAAIDIEVCDYQNQYEQHLVVPGLTFHWSLAKTRSGHNSERSSSLGGASKLADFYRDKLSTRSDTLLPLIAYYPVERAVLDIPLKINGKHSFEQLDGYENSLNQGVDFRRFFEWFRQREDAENEKGISEDMFAAMSTLLTIDEKMKKSLIEMKAAARDRQLNAVRTAIKAFMPGFENLRIQRKPTLMMLVDKDGKTLNVEQLSQGEKSLIALVGDIARRLAMMNPDSGYPSQGNPFIESPSRRDPLHGDGIILIDEADLHLHPKWQRTLIAQLSSTFPNCQFVLTTHSPLLISDSKNVLCYQLDEGELIQMDELYGLDANQVLLKVMDTDIRNADINEQLTQLLDNIQDRKLPQAQAIYDSLANELQPGHIELAKARLLIRKLELRHANNL